jgi:hypothetical protein
MTSGGARGRKAGGKEAMKTRFIVTVVLITLAFFPRFVGMAADLKPVGGVTVFGGAERGENDASGIGGIDLLGLLPLGKDVGIQGGLNFSGGQGFRFGLNAGPVLNFDAGKLGLFLDYEHRARDDFNYVGLRGIGGYYFDRFDALLSYSQPVSSVKRSGGTKLAGINELHGIVRFYPTNEIELNAGMLVNSFAGAGRHDNGGTGVGGSFGVSFKLFEPIVIQLVQAKFDNRERYRVTSGIQAIWGSPLQDYLREHISLPTIGGHPSVRKSSERSVSPPPPPSS